MRKHGKIILAAAVALSIILAPSGSAAAASATSGHRDEGWRQNEEGEWNYYSPDGLRAANTWVKSQDGKTAYYLDGDGTMAVNKILPYGDGIAYVDETGAQARNRWVALPNDALWDEPVETVYYYFGSDGKAFRDVKKRIDGNAYIFDSEGRMLSGWYEDGGDYYYLGTEDQGWVHTGWQSLVPEDPQESGGLKQWYYFRPGSGKANRGRRGIDGSFYYFDQDTAAAQTGWVEWEDQYAYYDPESGRMMTGWVYCQGPEESEEGWYYLDKDGVPFNYGGKDHGAFGDGSGLDYIGPTAWSELAAITLQGDTYLFNANGKMMTGQFYLWSVQNKGGKELGGRGIVDGKYTQGACYFFDDEEGPSLGKMLRGRQTRIIEGTEYEYYFANNGRAYLYYIIDGYLYGGDGTLWKAKDGSKYEVVDSSQEQDPIRVKGKDWKIEGDLLIVDQNGRVKENGKVVIDGYRYTVKNYVVVGTPEAVY